MSGAPARLTPDEHSAVHCDRCRDVIGVYEPMIAMLDGEPVITSRAAGELPRHARRYHGSCFAELEGERRAGR